MSITRERLDELVKQRAKIYGIDKSNNVFCVGLKFRDLYRNTEWWETKMQHYCDCYYETQKEAEFIVKYTKIPRYLNLPTWEEFCDLDKNICIEFHIKDIKYQLYKFIKNRNTGNVRIIIYADKDNDDWFVFEKPLTEENYYKALDECVKLWKGEE